MKNDWPFAPCAKVAAATRIIDVLALRAETAPDTVGYTYLQRGEPESLTYGVLFDEVLRTAARIREHVAPNGRALLLFGSGLDFVRAFLGCHAAGVVPVPVMPPRDATPSELGRVSGIFDDADTPLVITTPQIAQLGQGFFTGSQQKRWLTLDHLESTEPASLVAPAESGDVALIQYTSGSTAAPRGVVVGHDNLLRNLAYIYWGERNGPDTVSVSWLPMSHDMGLIEGVLQPLYSGHPVFLMSPLAFLKRPIGWLQTLSDVGATVSGGPNFAYDLVLRRLGAGPLPNIDLSRWRFAYNGSEPVRPETIEAFSARLAPVGFARAAMQPLYGLAEATLGVTASQFDAPPRTQTRVTATGERRLVSCGTPPDDMDLIVVDPGTRRALASGEQGEIWLNGPCVTRGYWRRPEATEAVFGATLAGGNTRYLRTGDLGFVLDGEVFISGRIKELIVARGQNVYPTDIEHTVEAVHPMLRAGGSAAFRVAGDDDSAGIVAEVTRDVAAERPDLAVLEAVARDVRRAVVRAHGVSVSTVALVAPGTIPRTTSGKRQRTKVGMQWQRGQVAALATCAHTPTTPAESLADWLPARIAALLGVDRAGLDTSQTLPELGLDSARSLELLAEAETRFGHLPIAALLGLPIDGLLDSLDDHAQTSTAPWVDDAVLPADIRVGPAPAVRGQTLLVTGATGFLGRHVVAEHLVTTPGRVRCLVRGEGGHARVVDALRTLPSFRPEWAARIEAVRADLSSPDLGIDEDAVIHGVCAIVHCAAMVNWVYPYRALAPTNVGGTLALIRLASREATPFVYLSSMACCWSLTAEGTVDEDTDPLGHIAGIHLDYVRTKAVAESLVRQAQRRGLPASIVRPGLIFSNAKTAQHVPGDFLSTLFRGCIEMGAAPDLDWMLDVCTVDEVARAALACADSPGRTMHLEAVDPRPWRAAVLWMSLRGHPMQLVPYDAWLTRLHTHAEQPGAALRPLRTFFSRPVDGLSGLHLPQLYEVSRRNDIDSRRSNAQRPGSPPLSADLLERTFRHLTATGYLSAPSQPVPALAPDLPSDAVCAAIDGALSVTPVGWGTSAVEVRHSIIGELAAWRFGTAAGLSRHRVVMRDGQTHTVVAKAQVGDTAALDIGVTVAGLCSEALGRAWATHRERSEVVGSAVRERALYRLDCDALRAHTPSLIGATPGVLVLEDLSELPLLNRADDPSAWTPADIASAIDGIAQVHAMSPRESLVVDGLSAARTTDDLVAQQSLWDALAVFALGRPLGRWAGAAGRTRIEALVSDVRAWHSPSDRLSHTLIHNDFSPRNAGLRPDGRLCAYDWELARLGLPQRDLVEFLCFTLPADDVSGFDGFIARHRHALERSSGRAVHPEDWRQGVRTALAELMVTRLPMYAMIDAFRPQPFLERVVRTWCALDRRVHAAD